MSSDITISVLQRLFTLMNAAGGAHGVFAGIADSACTLLEADAAAVFEFDDARRRFSLATARSLALESQVQALQALTQFVHQNETWFSHVQMFHNWGEQLIAQGMTPSSEMRALQGMISVPLRASNGVLLGVMVLFYKAAGEMTGRRQVLASLLGSLAAVSLDNARLYEQERHRADFFAEVLRVGEAVRVDQSLEAVLQQVVEVISRTLGWQTVVVALHDSAAGVTRPVAGVFQNGVGGDAGSERMRRMASSPIDEPRPWRSPIFKVSRSYIGDYRDAAVKANGHVAGSIDGETVPGNSSAGESVTRPFQTKQSPMMPRLESDQWQPTNFLVVPLAYKDTELGWISVDAPRDNRYPGIARIQELEVFADQLALAVINARLYHKAETERLMLTTLLDGITDGVLAFTGDGRLMFSNRAAERLLGLKLLDHLDEPLEEVLAGSLLLAFLQRVKGDLDPEHELYLPQQKRTLFVSTSPLPDGGQLVMMQDVTYFREMEMLRLELLSSLSHDLKNPLSDIGLIAALIERSGPLNDRQREYVDRLRDAAKRAFRMISDLLDMARLEAGERIEEEPCALAEIIEEVLLDMVTHAEEKQIDLAHEKRELPDLLGDEVRLRQVVSNLVSNAIKYTPNGGQVRVSTVFEDSEVHITVEDNGLGIPPEHQERIFDRFYRVNPTMSDEIEGTGLGLAIVKTIVERHAGRIKVASTLGQGSTFTVTLPVNPVVKTPLGR